MQGLYFVDILNKFRAALASTKGDVETAVNLLLNGTSAAWENEGGVTEPDGLFFVIACIL